MAVARHTTFTNTNRHGVTYNYDTLQHCRHTKIPNTNIYYVTTKNMADARHTTFTNTNLNGVTAYTYVTKKHGQHTKIPIHTASRLTHKTFHLSTHFHTDYFKTEWIQMANYLHYTQMKQRHQTNIPLITKHHLMPPKHIMIRWSQTFNVTPTPTGGPMPPPPPYTNQL
jgi:hypothetical protein